MTGYRGRFAPTPSGPLHFGSMVAAVGSYLDARANGGEWLLRIDDLDPPRVAPGANDAILRCLEGFGMEWDGDVVYQSGRAEAYHAELHRLRQARLVYPCACSRKEIGESGVNGIEGAVYPGTCREGIPLRGEARALRVRTDSTLTGFDDLLQGRVDQVLETDVGDFVVYRADRVFAYHLACVVDDAEQGVTHVVRGADLIASTSRQIYLQRLLGLATPAYLHLPVAVNAAGVKLSKQTLAQAVDAMDPLQTLDRVLRFLGHPPPAQARDAGRAALWHWAIENWRRERLPRAAALPAPE